MRREKLAYCTAHDSTTELRDLRDDLFDRRCDKANLRRIWPDAYPDVSDDPCVFTSHD